MKELLILTGACGVGKSTIAEEWAKRKNGAKVDCDYLTEWIYNTDLPDIRSRKICRKANS